MAVGPGFNSPILNLMGPQAPSSILHKRLNFCGCLRNARPFRVFVARRFLHVWAELQMPRGICTQA